jgi:putative tricarboxylic transport membrane protein
MKRGPLRQALPYVVGLLVAVVLFHYANQIAYTPRAKEIGPDFWPKLAIGLMALVCTVEIIRALLGARDARGIAELLDQGDTAEQPQPKYGHLLIGGIVVVVVYAIVVPIAGFLLATLLFMVAFMYLGGYRNHLAVWAISAVATVLIGFLFLRFAYVSLPRGEPPFDQFTDFVRVMLGG